MARLNTQRVVNNFSGGLVTEANELTFPENSLAKAVNIELGVDGSLESRGVFSKNLTSGALQAVSGYDWAANLVGIRSFRWEEMNATILAYVYAGGYGIAAAGGIYFSVVGPDGTVIRRGHFRPYATGIFSSDKTFENLDITTSSKSFYFVAHIVEDDQNRSELCEASLSSGTYLSFSGRHQRLVQPLDQILIKEPLTGFSYQKNYTSYKEGGSGPNELYWGGELIASGFTPAPGTLFGVFGGWAYHQGPVEEVVGGIGYFARVRRERYVSSETLVTTGSQPIRYRDFEGVPNNAGGDTPPGEILAIKKFPPNKRFSVATAYSAYNLYNAGWGDTSETYKIVGNQEGTTIVDSKSYPLSTKQLAGIYPSISETYFEYTSDTGSLNTLGLYSPFLFRRSAPASQAAKRGTHILSMGYEFQEEANTPAGESLFCPDFYFSEDPSQIIDRQAFFNYARNLYQHKERGISSICIHGGRMWYSVFGMPFNLAYSQIKGSNLNPDLPELYEYSCCYQANNPNNEYENSSLATDGGTLQLEGIGEVRKLVEYRNYLLIFADNGVWSISGTGGGSFSPTDFSVMKLSNDGVRRKESVLFTEDGVLFLTRDALKFLAINENGQLVSSDLSSEKVLKKMSEVCRDFANGSVSNLFYDRDNKRVFISYTTQPKYARGWTLYSLAKQAGPLTALIYDFRLGSFYEWEIGGVTTTLPNAFDIPKTSYFSDYMPSALLFDDREGVCCLWQGVNSEGTRFTRDFRITGRMYGTHRQSDAHPSAADSVSPLMEVEVDIPYDLVGDFVLSKSVQTAQVLLSADPKYYSNVVVQGANTIAKPSLSLEWSWDWKTQFEGPIYIEGTYKYPEIDNLFERQVTINKFKIPGSGRCLSLKLKNNPGLSLRSAFKLLGYYLDINADSRP